MNEMLQFFKENQEEMERISLKIMFNYHINLIAQEIAFNDWKELFEDTINFFKSNISKIDKNQSEELKTLLYTTCRNYFLSTVGFINDDPFFSPDYLKNFEENDLLNDLPQAVNRLGQILQEKLANRFVSAGDTFPPKTTLADKTVKMRRDKPPSVLGYNND